VPARLVVLVSGTGTNLQALLDACADPAYGAEVVAVGADRPGTMGVQRARDIGLPTFELAISTFASRKEWDVEMTRVVAGYKPDIVVSAGFLKLVGAEFLERFGGRFVNTHNALLPSFPGIHGPRDALEYGVKVTGATLFVVDEGVDTGAIVDQVCVPVEEGDDEATLTERIKKAERAMLVDAIGRMARDGFTISGRKVSIP
jgi:formyltetrahydrofolate-dependent phosphoribosylglycinamide formyltransferase